MYYYAWERLLICVLLVSSQLCLHPPHRETLRSSSRDDGGGLATYQCAVCFACFLPILVALGVTMVVVGLTNVEQCSAEPKMPYLSIGK